MKKIAYKNLGCKVNSYEMEKIKRDFCNLGFLEVPFDDIADVYIVNTCSVTNVADRKSRQMLNRCKKENNKALVVAIGCFVDANPNYKVENIDIYIKNENKKDTAKIVTKYINENSGSKENFFEKKEIRQVIKIEDGCNQFCSYCIIPYLRGRVKSNSIESVMKDVEEAVSFGAREIVLTGIHLSSYGIDEKNLTYESEEGREFAREKLYNLILNISENENIERIRLGSLEPRLINIDFVNKLNQDTIKEKLCPSFHLALQSGSDKVLKDMNRHYTKEDYKRAVDVIRSNIENATITTDIIVGFPTETDSDFIESLDFAKSIRFYNPNVFKFSKRKNTKAYNMIDIDESIKNERSNIMLESLNSISQEIMNGFLGERTDILVEEIKENYLVGYNREYFKIFVERDENDRIDNIKGLLGKTINVKVYGKKENYLLAKK